jgi:hypothetical protein
MCEPIDTTQHSERCKNHARVIWNLVSDHPQYAWFQALPYGFGLTHARDTDRECGREVEKDCFDDRSDHYDSVCDPAEP